MTNSQIAAALDEIAVLLQVRGESEFRWKAYANAAHLVSELSVDVAGLVAAGRLNTVHGLAGTVGDKVANYVTTGALSYLEDLRATTPPGLLAMLRVPGLGPEKAKALYDALAPVSLAELEAACVDGRVAKVKGSGAKSAVNVLDGVHFLREAGDRLRYDQAYRIGVALLDRVTQLDCVSRAELAGELRRRAEVVGDVMIVADTADADAVFDVVVQFQEFVRLRDRGPDRIRFESATSRLDGSPAISAEVRAASSDRYPMALLEATGPDSHLNDLRGRATAVGRRFDDLAGSDETTIYRALGLTYLPPELREWPDALDVAERGAVPHLIRDSDIRGVFHNHTTASDGTASLTDMAEAAGRLGYEYFGLGDHSQSLVVANGLSPERVRRQWNEVDSYNAVNPRVRVVKGTECDIRADGSLDFADDLLAGFEYVVASVHTLFGMSESEQTERVCRALAHPSVTMLGHATGRLLLRRSGYKIDLERVIDVAARHGRVIEINAQPSRLDLDWRYCRMAKAKGVALVINPDAHSTADLEKVPYGVNVARRAGLTALDVLNSRDTADVLTDFARRRGESP